MDILRVKDWNKHFENNRTRELKWLDWVPMPVRMDGDGYTELVDHPQGAAHFGAWCAIVEVAAKCDPRGTLLREGGKPHNSDTLARITRINAKIFVDVIPRLISMGWLEVQPVNGSTVTEIPQEGAGMSQEGAGIPQEGASERNGTERNGTQEIQCGFAAFWAGWPKHPRKVDKAKCLRWWNTHRPDADAVMRGLDAWKRSEMWVAEGGKFIPLPMTWLNGRRWEDEPVAAGQQSSAQSQAERVKALL